MSQNCHHLWGLCWQEVQLRSWSDLYGWIWFIYLFIVEERCDNSWQVLILNVALEKLTWIGNSNCLHVKGSHLVSFRCHENPRLRFCCQKISYIFCSDSLGIFALGGKNDVTFWHQQQNGNRSLAAFLPSLAYIKN